MALKIVHPHTSSIQIFIALPPLFSAQIFSHGSWSGNLLEILICTSIIEILDLMQGPEFPFYSQL